MVSQAYVGLFISVKSLYFIYFGMRNVVTLNVKKSFILNYQIIHLSLGFIGEFSGHLKALANSGEFDRVPTTRIL